MEESAFLSRLLKKYRSAGRRRFFWGPLNCKDIEPHFTFGKANSEKNQNLTLLFSAESLTLLWLQATDTTSAHLKEKSFTGGRRLFPKSRKY